MQCRSCGTTLPAGAGFCTNCGTPAPYNVPSPGAPGAQPAGSPRYEPTVLASPSYDPTQVAPQSGQPGIPPTAYGTPPPDSYGAPPPPPNPYGTPPPNTYGAPAPSSTPYGYGAPYAPPPGSFIPPNQPPRRKGPGAGLIIGIVAVVLLLVIGGVFALRAAQNSTQGNTNTGTATTVPSTSPAVTPTTQGPSPSGSPIDPTSAAIITNAQTASAVDSNYYPSKVTSNFAARQDVYVTFHLTLNGQSGYVQAKLYSNTTYVGNKILTVQSAYDHGYFTVTLNTASTGIVELYWCTQADCSDAKLATLVTFNVS
jgi:flagellar basal body-associated protein FliL